MFQVVKLEMFILVSQRLCVLSFLCRRKDVAQRMTCGANTFHLSKILLSQGSASGESASKLMHFAVARSQVLAGCLLEIISFLPHGPLHGEAYITSNFSRASQQERKRTGQKNNDRKCPHFGGRYNCTDARSSTTPSNVKLVNIKDKEKPLKVMRIK